MQELIALGKAASDISDIPWCFDLFKRAGASSDGAVMTFQSNSHSEEEPPSWLKLMSRPLSRRLNKAVDYHLAMGQIAIVVRLATMQATRGGAMTAIYQPSPIKRARATKSEMTARRMALLGIVSSMRPMTVRQVFYQATVRGFVEIAESGYNKVQTDPVAMRRSGLPPYNWLVDNTRWQRKPTTYSSIEEALNNTAQFYRKSLWDDTACYVEVWLEKDALAGVVMPVTAEYDVPLMVARGYASLSFLAGAAEYIRELYVPSFIYHLGDFDPSGVDAGRNIETMLRELVPDAERYFERVAVTPEQIENWALPNPPTKQTDTRSKGFGAISVEFDAIEPSQLRGVVHDCIERHLPRDQLEVLRKADERERSIILQLVKKTFGCAR